MGEGINDVMMGIVNRNAVRYSRAYALLTKNDGLRNILFDVVESATIKASALEPQIWILRKKVMDRVMEELEVALENMVSDY